MTDKISELRSEIARSIKSVRACCLGKRCLRDCVRRMAAAAPCPRASRRRWGAAAAAFVLCQSLCAEVYCEWHGSPEGGGSYLCSGDGNSIRVDGPTIGGTGGVITNFLGGCTNCINVTPAQCQEIKESVHDLCQSIDSDISSLNSRCFTLLDSFREQRDDISTFRRFPLPSGNALNQELFDFTNYLYGTVNSQTLLVGPELDDPPTRNRLIRLLFYNDGIYDYANTTVLNSLNSNELLVRDINHFSDQIQGQVDSLDTLIDTHLNCASCGPPNPDEGGGGCDDCNATTNGNWCTVEQGDAIILLLNDTKDYVSSLSSRLDSISNVVGLAVKYLHDGLFSDYTHIPTEDELGMKWQDLYLEGYSSNFPEYSSSNILARIELLLAGMSGVLTNSFDFAEAGDFSESGMSSTNELFSAVSGFTNELASAIAQREGNVRSVGDSLIGLYNSFHGWSGTPFSRETLINSYSVEIGDTQWDVPSFEPSENGLAVANLIRVVCRSVMSVVYILFTVAIFIRFQLAFFQWVLKYLKWVIELMQGLFA